MGEGSAAHPLFLGQVERDGRFNSLDLLCLPLVHYLTGETLRRELLVEAGDLLVEGLKGEGGG